MRSQKFTFDDLAVFGIIVLGIALLLN